MSIASMVLLKLASAYTTALATAPLQTKSATAAIVAVVGDALAQRSDPTVAGYEVMRGQSFAAFGALYSGAWQHHLFGWLSTHCTGSFAAAQCTLLNQLLVVPLLYVPMFFLLSGLTRGLGLKAIVAGARQRYLPLLCSNWRFWLPVQTLCFACLTPDLLVPVTCCAGIVWNLILSSIAYSSNTKVVGGARPRRRLGARVGGRQRRLGSRIRQPAWRSPEGGAVDIEAAAACGLASGAI
uniref:Uncharacterized protein n=1 Tax=Haptolina ericina TaxID=156174 RepID=A0A7S3AQ08_9EUKA